LITDVEIPNKKRTIATIRNEFEYFEKTKLGFAMARLAMNKIMPINIKNIG
jgi:hypothetical protein